jgi:hypothetical protein
MAKSDSVLAETVTIVYRGQFFNIDANATPDQITQTLGSDDWDYALVPE